MTPLPCISIDLTSAAASGNKVRTAVNSVASIRIPTSCKFAVGSPRENRVPPDRSAVEPRRGSNARAAADRGYRGRAARGQRAAVCSGCPIIPAEVSKRRVARLLVRGDSQYLFRDLCAYHALGPRALAPCRLV